MFDTGQSVSFAVAFHTKLGARAKVTLTNTGQDFDYRGELIDPAVVELHVKDGAGVETVSVYGQVGQTYDIVRDQLGGYYALAELDEAGPWRWRWEGDPGTPEAKVTPEDVFYVRKAVLG